MKAHERLKQQRLATPKLSQEKLARKLNISVSHYARIEAGEQMPGTTIAFDIKSEFGIPMEAWVSSPGSVDEFIKP